MAVTHRVYALPIAFVVQFSAVPEADLPRPGINGEQGRVLSTQRVGKDIAIGALGGYGQNPLPSDAGAPAVSAILLTTEGPGARPEFTLASGNDGPGNSTTSASETT